MTDYTIPDDGPIRTLHVSWEERDLLNQMLMESGWSVVPLPCTRMYGPPQPAAGYLPYQRVKVIYTNAPDSQHRWSLYGGNEVCRHCNVSRPVSLVRSILSVVREEAQP